ncbi:MAG: hypothetical protein UR34_C0022G0005 [candidate division WS6 bacterium GW2011_GWC1_33_20]|uniref:Uncharacterized protein n=1 Tax=candidate division WS6 bacterium GW2011_GWC1_33_20 TaxID=1619089 RepID=A0A0F9ZFS1_9BACT|nr:MAG: hypothetical protein UR34_C0022G0005 [candidate division WS6 bacterium GW2011_GWC1_33_20]KKP43300.1 MAG: hypothetical protein UR32_C0002G0030 [candidate division WS6 bacterium GW2011_GWE2_33_157]KKP45768.1 MAG: hypothetical protein UR36_C0004G0029 [candidate division WS6 bacterium GW2011_GWF1_33_233]KKP55211.1 MAG: hypothetical protein UR45_C0003G0029 [candidate division WS6 bacterium GW2011_WS6_33_547]KKP57095.1 MAG: hypothetical protein UR49_C0003G0029 [candidate division WS6 bacteriu
MKIISFLIENKSAISDLFTAIGTLFIPVVIFIFEKKRTERAKRIEQTEIIAELLATWGRYPNSNVISKNLSPKEEREFFSLLNYLSYKAYVWVPNKKLLDELQKTLTNTEGALTSRELIVKIRQEIQGDKCGKISPSDIVTFPKR